MATGYTAQIKKGISFEDFVMSCARAFGALIMMRDEPTNKPIPEKFEPSSYHKDNIVEIEKELVKLNELNESQLTQKAKRVYNDEIASITEGVRKATDLRQKYTEMLIKVRAWQPPSNEHIGFKKFMIEQIESSIDFDCGTNYWTKRQPKLLTGQQWLEQHRQELTRNLAYHKKEDSKEIERTEGRNLWVQQLRQSLNK